MKKKHANWAGFLGAMAITGLVCIGVTLYCGDRAPRELDGTMPYFVAGTLIFAGLTAWVYYSKRFKLFIEGKNDKLIVEVADPSLSVPMMITTPFRLSTQWTEQHVGKGAKMKMLYVTIIDNKNEALVTFEGSIGSIHTVPSKFEYIDIFNEADRKRWIIAPYRYSTGKVRDIASEIHAFLTYLDRKKATAKS